MKHLHHLFLAILLCFTATVSNAATVVMPFNPWGGTGTDYQVIDGSQLTAYTAPKLGDVISIRIAGTADKDITDFQIVILDDSEEVGYYAPFSGYKHLGNITAGAPFDESFDLPITTLTQDGTPLVQPKIAFIGKNAALAGANGEGTFITLTLTVYDVSVNGNVECLPAKTICIRSFYSGDALPGVNSEKYLKDNGGTLQWSNDEDNTSLWYEIPVKDSDTDFYLKNVATGNYIYRDNANSLTSCDWAWNRVLLSATNGKTDFYKFRTVAGNWEWATLVVNVAGVNFANFMTTGAFVISAINTNHTACTMPAWNSGVVMGKITTENSGNAFTAIHYIVINASVENPDCNEADVLVTSVSLDKPTAKLMIGGIKLQLSETVEPTNAANKTVTWSSSNPAVATVVNGLVTSGSAGTTTITVTTQDGDFKDQCVVTVKSPADYFVKDDYQKALWMTTRFYGAQRSGEGPNWLLAEHTPTNLSEDMAYNIGAFQKGKSFLKDADGDYDLTGGWMDCGDGVKYGQTQYYSAYMLLLGYSEFPEGYGDYYSFDYHGYINSGDYTYEGKKGQPNGIPDILDEVRYTTDYFRKCVRDNKTFYYQVGNGHYDHSSWVTSSVMSTFENSRGGEMEGSRLIGKATGNATSMSSLCGATLAAMYRLYKTYDPAYAQTCLDKALVAYDFVNNTPKGNIGTADATFKGEFYGAKDDYIHDMIIFSIELYRATSDTKYIIDAETIANQMEVWEWNPGWTLFYGCTKDLCFYLLANYSNDATIKAKAKNALQQCVNQYKPASGYFLNTVENWGVLRYSANHAFVYALNDKLNGVTTINPYSLASIEYIMGKNSRNYSFIVGFGDNYPKYPHHRNIYLDDGYNLKMKPKFSQFGYMVGGTLVAEDYVDDMGTDVYYTEGGIDYSAGLVNALAYINATLQFCTKFTVTFDSNGGNFVFPQIVCDGGQAVEPVATWNTHNFAGWYTELTGGTAFNFTTPITADITLYARWTPKECDEISIRTVRIRSHYNAGALPGVNSEKYLKDNGGTLQWSDNKDDTSLWYEIPVTGSTTDFYLKNVSTGNYIYRDNANSLSMPGCADWAWNKAQLSAVNGKTDFYKFRKVEAYWGFASTFVVNVAGANFANVTNGGAFVLNAINTNHRSCSMPAWDSGVVMGKITAGNAGNAFTSIYYDELSANAENPDCDEVVVNAQTPTITVPPQYETIVSIGENVTLSGTASVTDGGTLSYEWYKLDDWSLVSTSNTYSPPTETVGTVYYIFYAINTNNAVNGEKTASNSTMVAVTVLDEPVVNAATPVITTHPQPVTVTVGGSATLSVTASIADGGTLSYQWYSNTEDNNIWSEGTQIEGANSSAYSPPTTTAGTMYYYVVVGNSNEGVNGLKFVMVTSNTALVTVTAATDPDCDKIRTVRIRSFYSADALAGVNREKYLSDNGSALQWIDDANNNSLWYEIPVKDSGTDFYFKNVATGNYIYRDNARTLTSCAGWAWNRALLSATNAKTDFYKFRILSGNWTWATHLVNVAGANFANYRNGGAFVLSAINTNHRSCSMPAWNTSVVMGAIDGGGNAFTSVRYDIVSTTAENPDCNLTGTATTNAAIVQLYPNPFSESVQVTGAAGAMLQIVNISGITIHIQPITDSNQTVELEHLPAGVYFFRFDNGEVVKMLKVK